MRAPTYSFDTDPHPVFDTYSAGNFGEVAPERLSIMSWSLIGDPVERGCRAFVTRLWPRATWHTGSRYTFVGYFSCRPYHNLSAFCHLGRDVPAVSPEDVAASYFEDAAVPRLPRGLANGRLRDALSLPRMLREFADLRPRQIGVDARVTLLEDAVRSVARSGSSFALGRVFDEARAALDEVWDVHYTATAAAVPVRSILRRLGERVSPVWSELEPWLGQPDELVWSGLHELGALATPMGSGEFLGRAFYEIADDRDPWRQWAGRPSAVAGEPAIRRDRLDVEGVAWAVMPWARAALLPNLSRLLVDAGATREATKSAAMRCLHAFRMLVPAIARSRAVADDDWPYLTIDELAGELTCRALAPRARRRREECADAVLQETSDPLCLRPGERDRRRPAVRRRGRGVSPGVVRGVVVTLERPRAGPPDATRILVCERADADVQPLLPSLSGVLTARGSALSHVAVLVREFRIPAVVGHDLAGELREGQQIELNGTTGEVTLLAT